MVNTVRLRHFDKTKNRMKRDSAWLYYNKAYKNLTSEQKYRINNEVAKLLEGKKEVGAFV